MEHNEIAKRVEASLTGARYQHTVGVAETAVRLAAIYGADAGKAEIAALLHDIARDCSNACILQMCKKYSIEPDKIELAAPELLHGRVGACIARDDYGITDSEILDAITYHTTGRRGMTVLEKVVFIADMVEPGRDFPGVRELRDLAFTDLDRAVAAGIDSTIMYVERRGLVVHPASIEARNSLLIRS